MKRSLLFYPLLLLLLHISCSHWGVLGPEKTVGDVSFRKISEITIQGFLRELLYSEPYLLALAGYSTIYVIDLSDYDEPVIEDSLTVGFFLERDEIVFTDRKIFCFSNPYYSDLIVSYDISSKPIKIDSFHYETQYYQILHIRDYLVLRKSDGFDVLDLNSMEMAFSFTKPDSVFTTSQRIYVDDSTIYDVCNDRYIYVFSSLENDSIVFTSSFYNYFYVTPIAIRNNVSLISHNETRISFEHIDGSFFDSYTPPPYGIDATYWTNDFVYVVCNHSEYSSYSHVLVAGPPYSQRKEFLCDMRSQGYISCLASSNEHLIYSLYRNQKSTVKVFEIKKHDRPWEK
jgi:hypothetical protein